MSHISLTVSADNPITSDILLESLAAVSSNPLKLSDREVEDYTKVLAGSHEVFSKILALPDYVPTPDTTVVPRENVHHPTGAENSRNAWACKASVVSSSPSAKKGLLAGKTVCLKDNIALAGVPCTLGTGMLKDWIPNTDATVVTRTLDAGGHILGKAACEALSFFGASISSVTGRMSNVYAEGYSAGGSSSGTAVLVASGDCDMGIGGDQGGSIRLPAAQNGIVGLKPTHGLIPYTGIALLESTIDTTGPMTTTVLDNALMLQVLAGADTIDDRQQSGVPSVGDVPNYPELAKEGVKGLKIGILSEGLVNGFADSRISTLTVKAAEKLREQGAVVEQVSVGESHALAIDLWMVIVRLSAFNNVTGKAAGRRALYMNDLQEKMVPLTQEQIDAMWPSILITLTNGAYGWKHLPPTLLGKTMNLARKVRDDYNALFTKYDALVMPTMPFLARKLPTDKELATMGPVEKMAAGAGISMNTCPFSLTGHPALSLPIGFLPTLDDAKVKLPVGMQIVAKWYDESTIFRVARAWEKENNWKTFE